MKVEDLKNYGKPLNLITGRIPPWVRARIGLDAFAVVVKSLGLAAALKIFLDASRERRRMAAMDLSVVREKGCRDEKFIRTLIQNTAFFSAMKNAVGLDKALEVHGRIMDKIAIPMNQAVLPSLEDIARFRGREGEFAAFRQYVLALWEADQQAGLHHYKVVEDSDSALEVHVTYCAYCQIPKALGLIEACEPACYSDDVFFPGFLEQMGIRFARTQTLGRKGALCDFRFERMN